MSNVLEFIDQRRRSVTVLRAARPDWRRMGPGWWTRPGPDGDVWVKNGLRERVFEAVKFGKPATELHCRSCGRPLRQGEIAYREVNPPADEPVSWRDVRICGGCVDGK